MKRIQFILVSLVIFTLTACQTVPISGRKQMNLLPESQLISMANNNYSSFMSSNPISKNAEDTRRVKEVGQNIEAAVKTFFAEKGLSKRIANFQWEYNLIESDVPNAWCMPGGKVVFYSGILPLCQNDAGIAVVMGHEIAHAVAKHGNERMSQGLVVQMGGMGLALALDEKPEQTKALFMSAYGVASQVGGLLPYSRMHEKEADQLGLIFMALAGYDPNEAVKFWERMSASHGGQEPPEFLSTHPNSSTRISDMRAFIPEAMKYYKKK